jgi:hypothetical protein
VRRQRIVVLHVASLLSVDLRLNVTCLSHETAKRDKKIERRAYRTRGVFTGEIGRSKRRHDSITLVRHDRSVAGVPDDGTGVVDTQCLVEV